MADLSNAEIEKVKQAFETVSMGTPEIDATEIATVLRALDMNPSQSALEKLGATKKEGKKILIEQMLAIYTQAKSGKLDKEGNYFDFVGILELYDRHSDRRASVGELTNALTSLGERLQQDEVEAVLKDCGDVDDDGQLQYLPFLKKLCEMSKIGP